MNLLARSLVLFSALIQDAAPLRENAALARAHAAPANLLEVTENVAFEVEHFANVGVTLLESSRPPTADEVARITPFMAEIGTALGEKFVKSMIARQHEDPAALADLTQLLRSRLYAVAHRSLMLHVAAGHDVTRHELLELVQRLRAPERDGAALAKLAIPPEAMELEPTLIGLHPVLRCVPYVLFAALHEPTLWTKERAAEREVLISDLLNAGAEDARAAAVVSRALDPPIDGVVALVEDGVRTEHPFAFAKLPERNRRVGFTENHLDVATELCDAITRERDAASRRDGADPFAGARAFLPGWAEEIRARIQRELIGQGRLAARIERPDDLIAIWRYRAEVWPWPDVAHEFERYFDDLAGGKVEHPASAEIARLDAKAESEPLTPEEEARRAELDRQRQNDTYRAVSQITLDVQRRMPSDEALRFLDKIATRIDQAQKDRTNRQLLATELSAAWNSAFSRAPDLACDRLRHAKDIESPWSAAAVAANCACEALCIAAPKSPQAAAALADFAVNAPNAALRWRGLVSARNLTPQQAEDVFSRALTDASSADPRWSAEDRRQLADGAVALADYNAASGSVSPEWLGESIVRVLEAGLWPEPAALGGDRDGRATRLANVLTDAQVAALEASGKLPAWVKAARAKPSGAK